MEPNIYVISEFPDKHHTMIGVGWGEFEFTYYINNQIIFRFYTCDGLCDYTYFMANINKNEQILELGPDDYTDEEYGIKLNRFEKLKELISNHTLSEEEEMAFKDYLCAYKLKFVD